MPKTWTNGLVLLPDENGIVALQDGLGLVHAVNDHTFACEAADAIHGADSDGPNVLAVRTRLLSRLSAGDTSAWRGLLSAVLLLDLWREPVELRTIRLTHASSAFTGAVLDAAGKDTLHLIVLRHEGHDAVLGMADREVGIIPAADMERLPLSDRLSWYDRHTGVFSDPCTLLNQRDRRRLSARLRLLGSHPAITDFANELDRIDARVTLDDDWLLRMKAAVSLIREPHFSELLTVHPDAYQAGRAENPLLTALGLTEPIDVNPPQQLTYYWHDVPFARSNAAALVEPACDPREEDMLTELRTQLTLLEDNSPRYQQDTVSRIEHCLTDPSLHLSAAVRMRLASWRSEAHEASRRAPSPLELTWPWDISAPSVRILLEEALGGQLTGASVCAFSDRLTLMTGGTLNDAFLDQVCAVTIGDDAFTALLPLSDSMAEYIARFGWSGSGMVPDSIHLTAEEDGAVTVTLLLAASGQVRLTRTYAPDEQIRWSADQIPEISMWPSIPMDKTRWKAYYVSVRGQASVSLLRGGVWTSGEPGDAFVRCAVTSTDDFPGCMAVHQDGCCLGAILYQAAVYQPASSGNATAAIELGSASVSMALTIGGQVQMVEMPSLWRVLLRGSRTDLPGEVLPVWPIGPVLPANAVIDRSAEEPLPFVNGRIVLPDALSDAAVREGVLCDLLWRTDAHGSSARRLVLHEAMLLTALHAVMCGAEAINWRLALPAGMTADRRELLLGEMRSLAATLREDTGLAQWGPAPEGIANDLASGAYLRESGLIRGSFVTLDVGAASASSAVWLRGIDHPVMDFCLDFGVFTMTVGGLIEHPERLAEDFSGLEALPVTALKIALEKASTNLRSWEQSRLLLDNLLGQHLAQTMPWMNGRCAAGRMTYTQALLVLGFAELMTLIGLELEKLYRSPTLNDHLPQELPLCLCGQGSQVMTALDETMRYQLMRFLRLPMSGTHPVRSIRLTVSGTPRMEAVLGLSQMPVLPRTHMISLGPSVGPVPMLVKYFLLQFRTCFPQAAALLFPGMFGPNNLFSPTAENVIDAAAAHPTGTEEQAFLSALTSIRSSFSSLFE